MTPTSIRRYGPTRRIAASLLAVTMASVVGACGSDNRDTKFCAVAEGSLSTNRADIRGEYLAAFARDLEWFARQPGTSPMCLILAVGDPTSNPIPTVAVRAANPNSPDAEDEVASNVELVKSQFAQVLASARDERGTPIVEALYALAVGGDLRSGDTVSVYSDMRQDSGSVKTVDLVRGRNEVAQAEAIDAALDRLAAAGLLPDGQDGRPSFAGIRLVVPKPSASADVSDPKDPEQEAARQVVAKQFWEAWRTRVDAELVWAQGAGGGRG